MREEELQSVVSNGFKSGVVETGDWSYEIEIFLLTLKSVVPSLEHGGNRIDYIRFRKELELWKNYRHGGNRALMEALKDSDESYWEIRDESIYMRMLAIALSNEDADISKEEVLKNIAYTTAEPVQILEGIYLVSFLNSLFKGTDIEEAKAVSKEAVIRFSLKEELVNSGVLKFELGNRKGKYIVDFERRRIELLDKLSGKDSEAFRVVDDIWSDSEGESSSLSSFLSGLRVGSEEETDFSRNIAKYIWKLRKGWISYEQIKVDNYVEPDIFEMVTDEVKYHSLLNKIQLLSIEDRDGFEIRHIKTKSGTYRFFKRKNGR